MKSLAMKHDYPGPVEASPSGDQEVYYPSVYIDTEEELDIPETGTATIKFVRTKVSEETRKGKPTRYCYALDITAIGDVKKSSARKREDSATVVDRLLQEITSDEDDD